MIFIIAGHMYRTNWGIGHSIKEILNAHKGPLTGAGHTNLYDTINNSLHFQLGLALASLGVITSLVAQHMYSLPSYAFIAQDHTTQAALYTHHQYIAGFLMLVLLPTVPSSLSGITIPWPIKITCWPACLNTKRL